MKVHELQSLLQQFKPDAEVCVVIDGSVYPTDNLDEHQDYNDGAEQEFFIITSDYT